MQAIIGYSLFTFLGIVMIISSFSASVSNSPSILVIANLFLGHVFIMVGGALLKYFK
jgi:hypothetical protein